MDDEKLAMFVRRFRKFFKPKKGNFRNKNSKFFEKSKCDSKETTQKKNETVKKDKNSRGIKCYEHSRYGHIWVECANLNKSKGKALNPTQSTDKSDKDDPEDTPKEGVNYLAFTASYESSQESHEYNTLNMHDSSDEDDDLQVAYNNLF